MLACRGGAPVLSCNFVPLMPYLRILSQTLRLVGGHHTRRTASFVKAALAYLHVTVPSLPGALDRVFLFAAASQTALANGMVAQADTFLRIALSLIQEVPPVAGL